MPLLIEPIVEIAMKTMTLTILSAIVLAGLAGATPAFATGFDANFVVQSTAVLLPVPTLFHYRIP